MYYAVFLFEQAGLGKTSSSLLANGLQGVVLNLFTYPNMYYMDTWGRRWPMVIGGVGMGISMMVIGVLMKTTGMSLIFSLRINSRCTAETDELFLGNPVYDQLTQKTNFHFTSSAASHTVIAFVYIYVAVFAITWACVAWVYPPEIFSMSMRGRATSMTTATNWFVVSFTRHQTLAMAIF
jgi:MFS family permease